MEEWRGEARHTISVAAARALPRAIDGKEGGKLRAAIRPDEHCRAKPPEASGSKFPP